MGVLQATSARPGPASAIFVRQGGGASLDSGIVKCAAPELTVEVWGPAFVSCARQDGTACRVLRIVSIAGLDHGALGAGICEACLAGTALHNGNGSCSMCPAGFFS